MSQRASINARQVFDAASTEVVEVGLVIITHPALDAPIRLSTDPTERLSDDPLQYGTRSNWMESDPLTEPFLFAQMDAEVPSDLEDVPAATTLILPNVDQRLSELLLSFTSPATVHMAVVFSHAPDVIEHESRNMKLSGVEGNVDEITLTASRRPIEDEIVPMQRMTKNRCPGLHR